MDTWIILGIVAKFALYLGVISASGLSLFALAFRPKDGLVPRSRLAAFALLGATSTVASLSIRGGALLGTSEGMVDFEMLGFLLETPAGTAFWLRIGGMVLILVGLFLPVLGRWLCAVGAIIALWSFSNIGHAIENDGAIVSTLVFIHLIFVALWVGALGPIHRAAIDQSRLAEGAALAHSFGVMASVFVPVLLIAGGVIAYHLLGTFAALFTTSYGLTLLIKIFFVAALLALAASNKLRYVPSMQSGSLDGAASLAKVARLEWWLIIAIFGATAVLTRALTLP